MSAPTMIISCPTCKKKFKGKQDLAGKKIKCPLCTAPFLVPAAAAPAAPETAVKPAVSTPPPPPQAEAYGVTDIDLAARCPNCAKPMAGEDAIICLFCGYNTLTRTHGETKKTVAISLGQHLMYLLPALSAAATFLFLVLFLLFFNLVVPGMVMGSPKLEWISHESIRMWSLMLLLVLLWGLGVYSFNTLVLRPKPPELEKE